ncbi:ABC transporter ATP-binding protein [Desulfobacula sp.]|mgnify:CR=1 FL=1|jgi:ABC-type branched-subunit amino acid transport system ATPase component|uniref:ABC transporter ATP-binding protein n=1 Tax=Desulfobacula sp. TaxID=2593537 RepID=UPI0039B86F80
MDNSPQMEKQAVLACSGITLQFGGRAILEEVDCHVSKNEVLGIIGPNGAGKTSFLEVLSGRYTPVRGHVFLNGHDVSSRPIHKRAMLGLARTFQTPVVPYAQTVYDVLKSARKAFKPYLSQYMAEWACDLVGLKVPKEMLAGALDTLDRRKLLLACLLMRRPCVLLLDEPASGLINVEIDEIDLIIRLISKELGCGIIVVEHRLELLAAIAERVMVLNLGKKIAEGPPQDVFNDPTVQSAYFEA